MNYGIVHHQILKDIEKEWKQRKPYYQTYQSDLTIDSWERQLTRLKSYIQSKDKTQSLVQLEELKQLWKELNDI